MERRKERWQVVFGYIVRRVLWLIPVLFFVSVITFTMMHAAPGGPWARDKRLPDRVVNLLNAKYGLDDPWPIQYLTWVGKMVTGDLGPSYRYIGRSVNDIMAQGAGTTVQLGLMAFLLSVVIGLPLGIIAALRHNKFADYFATFISVIGISTPSFILATLLIFIFSVQLHWFPTGGWKGPQYWVLPTLALASFEVALIARYTRASLLEVTKRDYVRTAFSKGLKERSIVVIHMIRNALIPIVTILGPLLAFLVTGSFIIETIFNLPGMGRFYVQGIAQRDYGLIMATTMLYAAVIALMNLLVDVAYAYIDPRIRYS
jgi:oligopeptide transport system permease protein